MKYLLVGDCCLDTDCCWLCSVAVPPQSIPCRICSAVVTAVCYLACILTLPISACFVLKVLVSFIRHSEPATLLYVAVLPALFLLSVLSEDVTVIHAAIVKSVQ